VRLLAVPRDQKGGAEETVMKHVLVPDQVLRSLALMGVKSPIPVEEFFDTNEGEPMTKNPADTPPAAEQAEPEPNPFENLVPGRVVHYWPLAYEERHCSPGPWPAIVTRVGEGGVLTLNVQMPVPAPVGTDPVCRMEKIGYSPEKQPGSWSWIFPGQAGRYKPDRTA